MSNNLNYNLTRLSNARTNIASAITAKGGTVGNDDGFEDFVSDIATIPVASVIQNGTFSFNTTYIPYTSNTIAITDGKFVYINIKFDSTVNLPTTGRNYIDVCDITFSNLPTINTFSNLMAWFGLTAWNTSTNKTAGSFNTLQLYTNESDAYSANSGQFGPTFYITSTSNTLHLKCIHTYYSANPNNTVRFYQGSSPLQLTNRLTSSGPDSYIFFTIPQ